VIVPVKGVAAMNVDLRGIAEGDALGLVAEPENQHDPHAIRVEHGGRRIGYLAKELAARITADAYEASVAYVLRYENVPAGLRILLNRREQV
jgi:HIRAN domain